MRCQAIYEFVADNTALVVEGVFFISCRSHSLESSLLHCMWVSYLLPRLAENRRDIRTKLEPLTAAWRPFRSVRILTESVATERLSLNLL